MSRGLASLVAALGATMGGYAQGNQMYRNQQRQDKMDAQQDEEYQFQKAQRDKAQALDKDIGAAMADRQVETVAPPQISNTDISMPQPDTPQYKVGDQTYADETQARAALQGVNSKAAKYQRAAQAAAGYGAAGVDKAAQYDAIAKQALNEGTDQILGAIQSSAPSLADVKKAGGMVAGTVGQQAADVFNQTGGRWKVSPDTVVQHFVDKDAAGREFVNSRVVGADGKPIVDDVRNAGLMLQDYKTRLEAQRADTSAFQTGQQIAAGAARDAESARHDKATEAEVHINNQALRGIQAGTLALAQKKDEREAQLYKNQTIDGQIEQIEKIAGPLAPADRKDYAMRLAGLTKGKGVDEQMVSDITKKWSENNPQATAPQVAKFSSDLRASMLATHNNAQVEQALKTEFAKHAPGTPGYAQTWNDAKSDLGMTDAQLANLGYKPPVQMVYNPVAGPARPAAMGTGRAPSGETVIGQPVDVRNDPTLAALNEGAAKLAGKTDPQSVQQLMALGTAKNQRIAQLQQNYGPSTNLITE